MAKLKSAEVNQKVLCWHVDHESEDWKAKDAHLTAGKVYLVCGTTAEFVMISNDAGKLDWYRTFKFDDDLTRDPSTFHQVEQTPEEKVCGECKRPFDNMVRVE